MENYNELVQVAVSILVILAGMALRALQTYLAAKTDNENLKAVEAKVFSYLADRVRANQATAVKIIQAKLADNKITKDEAREALLELGRLAVADTKKNLGAQVTAVLEKNYKDVEAYLSDKVETVVEDIKK